jgi:hypothetical protein
MEENIGKPDLYVCETSSPISDQFISTSSVGEQPSLPVRFYLCDYICFYTFLLTLSEKVIYM